MPLYLVVAEDGEGMWLDEPTSFETLLDARREAKGRVRDDATIVIYSCHEKEVFTKELASRGVDSTPNT